jgi:GT2 family glycosyltransferase
VLLSIIIPVFNQWALTAQCLESLQKTTPGDDFEVIVVDNGSIDETPREAPLLGNSLFGNRFKHLRSEENLNFGPGCNLGARNSAGRLLFFLNNDTILTPNWLPPLLQELESDPSLGAVGPLLLFPNTGRVQHLGVTFVPGAQAHHLYSNFPADHPLVHKKRYVKALTGAALMLPRALFLECGGFFDEYVNGWEDVDLCCEIGKRGKRLLCGTSSVIYHLTSQTVGRFTAEEKNYEVLIQRQGDWVRPDYHKWIIEDGYEPRLTECLRMYPALTESRRNAVEEQVGSNPEPLTCLDVLEKEPLWFRGYDIIAGVFETNGRYEEALMHRHLLGLFLPTRESLVKELKTSRRAGNPRLAELTTSRLAEIEQRLANREVLDRYCSAVLSKANQWGDLALFHLYSRWLTDLNPLSSRNPRRFAS